MGWFRKNEMVVNSEKVQAIILKTKEAQATHKLTIDNKDIKTGNLSVIFQFLRVIKKN